jgi:transketolase C-terminal domain/subunit
MTTAIIGTGGIGSVIARQLAAGGEPLRLSSADPESARTLAARIGPAAVAVAGVTVHGCLAAANNLAADGIHARVIDLYSVKPIDTQTLLTAVAVTHGRLVVAEDHHPEGGLGSAVTQALLDAGPQTLRVAHLAVRDMPGSGTGEELMAAAGIDAKHIEAAARNLLNAK